MNIQNHSLGQQTDKNLYKISTILFLLAVFCPILFASVAYSAVPIEEIKSLILQKALVPSSSAKAATLNALRLNEDLKAIDPYALYIPVSRPLKKTTSVKLGINVFPYKSVFWVRTDPDGPARKAGVPEVGRLLAINKKKINNIKTANIATMIDEAVRSQRVVLTVSDQSGKQKNYNIKPVAFQIPSITWYRVRVFVVIAINEFVTHETAPKFFALYKTLVKSGARVIIDLRGCPGGDIYEALEIAGLFVPEGLPMIDTYDRTGKPKTYRSQSGPKLQSPTWLLVDNRTASSAEMFAGILQYYRLSRLIGENTFGKFCSQTVFPLSGGGELWLTTITVRLPDNLSHTGIGINPDIPYPDISIARMKDITKYISKGFR